MDNYHLHVIAVVLYFNLPGSVGAKSQWILPATHRRSECRWDGQLLLNCSFTRISTIPEDTSQAAVTADLSYNNIKTFVCSDGRNEEWMLKHLNLSNNLISELTLTACTNLPNLETLNLSGNAIHTLTLEMPIPAHRSKKYSIVDRLLPALKVLSVERNNLNTVPRGLGLLQSLQTVHMSSNAIQQIDPKDFQNCSQLKDIDLRNNRITKIHPDAFRDLKKLQVVDLRENALTIPLPQILVSLNFFQLEVYLSKNAWIFNCRLNAFRHFFHFVFDSTRQKWSLSYNKSANNPQKPLLYLSHFHLNCRDNVVLRRATVPTGNTSVLTCNLDNIRGNGVSWWTPKGRISKNHSLPHMTLDKMNNLVIYNVEKTAEGLYLCLFNTTKEKYLIYNIEVKEGVSAFLVRKARDTLFREKETEPNFALAVSLSVLITFVCAFCLGAFARPYLESLWRLMHRNKNSGSEHTYSNQGFSDETLSRESSASKPTNMQHNTFICDKNSLRNTRIFPTEASTVYENVTASGVHSPNPKAEYQKQSNIEINMKKIPVFSKAQTSTDNYESINAYDTRLFFVKTDYQNSNKITPNSKVRNNSGLLQSEITKATPDSPERKGAISHNKPRHTRKFMQRRQSCEEQLCLNGNKNIPSDVGDFTPPSSFRRDADIEKLGIYETIEKFPTTEHDCKRIYSDEKDAAADIFGDSSSAEGTPFTMSDCSSLADFEVEHPGVSDNLPVCQSPLEEANTDCGTEKFVTPPESPNNTAELQQTAKNEDENNACFETTINYGSDTTMQGTVSPYTDKSSSHVSVSDPDTVSSSSQEIPVTFDYFTNAESTVENSISDSLHNRSTDFGNRVLKLKPFPTYDTEKTSEEDELQFSLLLTREPQHFLTFSHTEQKENAPAGSTDEHTARNFPEKNHGEADIKAESTEENSISDSLHNQSTDFGNRIFKLKSFPTYDTEKTSEEDELQLSLFPREQQHFLSFSHTEQKGNAPAGSTDEHTARNSSEKNHGEADITLQRNMSTSEDNGFIFAPIDTGLNEVVKKPSLLHSSQESSLQLLPEHTAEKHLMFIIQEDDLLPQQKQACADEMQGDSDEKNSDGFTELQESSNHSLPEEMQSCRPTAVLLHLHSSGKTQSEFTTDDPFQLDQSDEDAYSFSIPQGFFNESTPYSSCSFTQKPTGNTILESTDSSKMKDHTTLTELENHSAITGDHFQNSSENLSQKSRTNSGQDQFFVKKKRAFDGFANILQSRRTNFSS
ncbi:leucine-rich repeat-containing protein 66 [Geospiza fortis]|uniref:Leucine-rich repeat-containing protein 66 n=1 Tax=Geospiza fortis TaxID=48883 RepID=A0A6I9ZF36_GEOFO|nr:leucine-rich repeat-containing protein 66 [Geospiza fortis]